MSRTQKRESLVNPAKYTIEWAGGEEFGYFKRWDKEAKQGIDIKELSFACLDQLSSLSGWKKETGACFSNEIHSTKQEELTLRVFVPNGVKEVKSGLYAEIKDECGYKYGAKYTAVLYSTLINSSDSSMENGSLIRILLKGCGVSPWFDLKDKEKGGWSVSEYKQETSGKVTFRSPVFKAIDLTDEEGKRADEADMELQEFLRKKAIMEVLKDEPKKAEDEPATEDVGDGDEMPF